MKNEQASDTYGRVPNDMSLIRVPDGEGKNNSSENIFEKTLAENSPNALKDINYRSKSTVNPRQSSYE